MPEFTSELRGELVNLVKWATGNRQRATGNGQQERVMNYTTHATDIVVCASRAEWEQKLAEMKDDPGVVSVVPDLRHPHAMVVTRRIEVTMPAQISVPLIGAALQESKPRRCDTGECDFGGECIACGAISGEVCRRPVR
jgi:hypothetical protein